MALALLLLLCLTVSPPPADMVLVPAGDFWMGRYRMWLIDEIGWQVRDRMDDRPMHLVRLDAFYIDAVEVTNEGYARFIDATRHREPFHWAKSGVPESQPRLPVYNVSWDDARAYCAWAGKRLPTEAEWEKAARGGLDKTAHPWGDELAPPQPASEDEQSEDLGATAQNAHYGYPEGPIEVGNFAPNGYGLYDVIGNVWEWVEDGYELYYYSVSPRENPLGPVHAPYRVYRGGGWADRDPRLLSVFFRNFTDPATRTATIGFRCAQSVP